MPVISVTEGQQVDLAGTVQEVYEIVFTVSGRPGSFTVQVPKSGDAVAAAAAAIGEVAGEVGAIYGL
jgi:hypothetical protein